MNRKAGYYSDRRSAKRSATATRIERAFISSALVAFLMFAVFLVGAGFYYLVELVRTI